MPYDREIEQMIGSVLGLESGVAAKPMFGGICYLVGGNMAFGIYRDNLIIRLGSPDQTQKEIASNRALPFDITGKALKGWVMIPKARLAGPPDYEQWLQRGLRFAGSLAPKVKSPGSKAD
jgi:TfoX/Sxy family transcriptional regulator of competence genes